MKEICNEDFDNNFKIFQFIYYININYSFTIEKNIISNKLIEFYLYILYEKKYFNKLYNYIKDYDVNIIINEFLYNYNQLDIFEKKNLYNKLLFNYNDFKCYDRVKLINEIYNRYDFAFENNFDIFITNNFYNTITKIIKFNNYEFKYDSNKEIFNNYILLLEKISNDNDYMLLNKLEILNNIFINKNYTHTCCSYYKLIYSFNYIPLSRLRNNYKWLNINNKIWNKIYSNKQVVFNNNYYIDNFIAIDKT